MWKIKYNSNLFAKSKQIKCPKGASLSDIQNCLGITRNRAPCIVLKKQSRNGHFRITEPTSESASIFRIVHTEQQQHFISSIVRSQILMIYYH